MIAFHASHEQFTPSRLLKLAIAAEKAGFDAIHSSDHFHPWSVRQGQSGFSFSWVAAALQATKLPVSMVCAPGQRYHPAIVAQAIATIGEMFPGRFAIELGSGEALNELITGTSWPSKQVRNERLLESANVIKKLMTGAEVTYHGHINIKNARLYTLPELSPPLFCCAISEETARWCGTWADGLLTTAGEIPDAEKKIEAFRRNGGKGKPVYAQLAFSFAPDREAAIDGAYDQWRSNLVDTDKLAGFSRPEDFDEATKNVTREEVAEKIPIVTDLGPLLEKCKKYQELGISRVILHNVNTNQEAFIDAYKQANSKQ